MALCSSSFASFKNISDFESIMLKLCCVLIQNFIDMEIKIILVKCIDVGACYLGKYLFYICLHAIVFLYIMLHDQLSSIRYFILCSTYSVLSLDFFVWLLISS